MKLTWYCWVIHCFQLHSMYFITVKKAITFKSDSVAVFLALACVCFYSVKSECKFSFILTLFKMMYWNMLPLCKCISLCWIRSRPSEESWLSLRRKWTEHRNNTNAESRYRASCLACLVRPSDRFVSLNLIFRPVLFIIIFVTECDLIIITSVTTTITTTTGVG
jgi:hypothetical protein